MAMYVVIFALICQDAWTEAWMLAVVALLADINLSLSVR